MEALRTSALFLTESEKIAILTSPDPVIRRFRKALAQRVTGRLTEPGLQAAHSVLGWWYPAAEYLSDAAMQHALDPTDALASWLRSTVLGVVRRPTSDWAGPWFRSHAEPFTGHLETAHVCWGVAAALMLAGDLFSEPERDEIRQALQEKGVVLCQRWLAQNTHLANWRGIMASGAVVASVALGATDQVLSLLPELTRMAQAFQPDGSYGESLQYGNYLANALMLAYEALIRSYPDLADQLDPDAYGRGMAWMAQSILYRKPLSTWGETPRARAVNFNDSAALFRPSGDLLLHLAARATDSVQAGLARWLFQEYYEPDPTQGPHDLATFGMVNDWGFLTLPLLLKAGKALSPTEAHLPLTAAFSNGNTLVRDAWNGQSVLAIQGGNNDGVYAPGHLQGDLNSFMLAYNRERLLVDPGHSCYRNLMHGLECATQTHNTCTFLTASDWAEQDALGLQEDLAKIKLLEQRTVLARRIIRPYGSVGAPVERGGRLLATQRVDDVSLVVSEVAATYGAPIQQFTRIWLQIGAHVTFIIDRIQASKPVRTVWNWLLNNRDGASIVQTEDNKLTLYRHRTGLKLWHIGQATLSGPVYAYLHDAYHPEPAQRGEGRPGSGLLFRHTDAQKETSINRLHILAADDQTDLDSWTIEVADQCWTVFKPGVFIQLTGSYDDDLALTLIANQINYRIRENETAFTLERN